MTALTRGPLPARVYWTRRLLVLGTALALVVVIARVLTGGSDASSADARATPVAAAPTVTVTPSSTPVATTTKKPGKHHSHAPVLAAPSGPCSDEDIAVEPDVKQPVAGSDVRIVLKLRTLTEEACTWRVSKDTLTVKVTSGKDEIWSSRQCPRVVPTEDVVVRRAVTETVALTWNAKRSDDTCSRFTDWALPGYYHVVAAALAGEPADLQFKLDAPSGPVITRSPSPTQSPHQSKHGGRPQAPSPSSSH
ncbi:hypothetical protein [Nocardioides sp. LS1]|uniref:hypothetical protein n=1 Tax=Nocardioides sp. LS1 TaxID=1027620 RepID=UPI000F61BAAB|nr:hypothetical protein [Nocardioides sp. LS1]GCD89711.1 hypothetical protein NLS1_17170 [Nocardioides sp. LS1]